MSLTAKDKAIVKDFFAKIASKADAIGQEALGRMLLGYPQSKTYFPDWTDFSMNSPHVKKHGKNVMSAITGAVGKIDDLIGGMSVLSDIHAIEVRLDPVNYKVMSHNILVTLAIHFPADFTAEVHVAVDKFLAAVSAAISDKYR